jgi:adenosine deaminase
MLREGLNVSVNSDDPAYFGGYVDDNLNGVRDALGLNADELVTLATNSVTGSFANDARKAELLAEIAAAAKTL